MINFDNATPPSVDLKVVEKIRALLKADEKDQILLSPSPTISTNAVFHGAWNDISKEYGKNHFLSTQIEDAAKLFCLGKIEEMGGISTILKVNKAGALDAQTLAEGLSPRSALLSLSLAHPVLGCVQPMEEIGKMCQERGVLLHIDLTAAMGKIDFSLKEMRADIATFPQGLWFRQGVRLSPFILGSEPGMMGGSAPLVPYELSDMLEIARLRSHFEATVKKEIPEAKILFQTSDRLPCTSVILFPYVVSETLLYALAQKELYACIGGGTRQEISHLLQACGVEKNLSKCGLSFTFSPQNTEEEVEHAVQIIKDAYQKYAKLSQGLFT